MVTQLGGTLRGDDYRMKNVAPWEQTEEGHWKLKALEGIERVGAKN